MALLGRRLPGKTDPSNVLNGSYLTDLIGREPGSNNPASCAHNRYVGVLKCGRTYAADENRVHLFSVTLADGFGLSDSTWPRQSVPRQ